LSQSAKMCYTAFEEQKGDGQGMMTMSNGKSRLRVQSAYDYAGKNNKGGRLNHAERERGGEREKCVEGVVRR